MQRFLIQSFLFAAGVLLIIFIKNYNAIINFSFDQFPNVSNSVVFRARVSHLLKSENFRNNSVLIAGSSMAMNDVSGELISEKTGLPVYNISSHGMRLKQVFEFLKILKLRHTKYLLYPFNNVDFGENVFNIDMEHTRLIINRNQLLRYFILLKDFNLNIYSEDLAYKNKHFSGNNTYESINFDNTGSMLFDSVNFKIDKSRWNAYADTTGFFEFTKTLRKIDAYCKGENLKLVIIYLPYRRDILTEENKRQNVSVAEALKAEYKMNFINLSELDIPSKLYCDGSHLFSGGAIKLTGCLIDSLALEN